MTNSIYWIQLHSPVRISLLSWLPDARKPQTKDEVVPLSLGHKFCVEKEEIPEDVQKWCGSCRSKQTEEKETGTGQACAKDRISCMPGMPITCFLGRWSCRAPLKTQSCSESLNQASLPRAFLAFQRDIVGTSLMSRSVIKHLLFLLQSISLSHSHPWPKKQLFYEEKKYVWKFRDAEQSPGSGSTITIPQRKDYFRDRCQLPLWTLAPWHSYSGESLGPTVCRSL